MGESHLFRPFGPAPWDNYREKNGIPENTGPTFYTPSKKECKRIRKEMKKIEMLLQKGMLNDAEQDLFGKWRRGLGAASVSLPAL